MYVGGVVGSVPWKQSKLSLTLTLTWGNCEGSCSKYNWDSWTPCIALHASQNVVEHLKRLETIQVIEHSAAVNACKKSNNSYSNYRSQVTTVFIRRSTKSPYILYGTPSKFYPSPRTWCHYASQPLKFPGVLMHTCHVTIDHLPCLMVRFVILHNNSDIMQSIIYSVSDKICLTQ